MSYWYSVFEETNFASLVSLLKNQLLDRKRSVFFSLVLEKTEGVSSRFARQVLVLI